MAGGGAGGTKERKTQPEKGGRWKGIPGSDRLVTGRSDGSGRGLSQREKWTCSEWSHRSSGIEEKEIESASSNRRVVDGREYTEREVCFAVRID